MLELVFVLAFGILAYRSANVTDEEDDFSRRLSDRLSKLWDIAHQGMRENRFLRAEKALLTILKIDQKNAAAYNRLGILYAKQKEYKDAIDCFEIASSIDPSASSLHNLGLIYYETENYQKAAVAFEQALKLEDSLAARHIAYAETGGGLSREIPVEDLDPADMLDWTPEQLARAEHGGLLAMLGRDAWPAALSGPDDGTDGNCQVRELRRLFRLYWPAEDDP